ncbi:FAD-binding oxidoreductase [Pelagibacterales bacterium SAG-MED31]|nr:FAD-binding oxidoreductase [Pelagibacterales bacterium SAG-MED31]
MNNKLFKELKLIVGERNILTDLKDLEKFNKDWRGFYNNKCLCVVFPKNTEILKKIVRYCYERDIKIVPQSGNTSLTGASVPTYNKKEIIINFSKMNKVLEIDKSNLTILVESGLVLDKLKEYLDKENLYFPIDLSSSGSCMIGGNIATNAGGINALKYGSMKDNVIGLEIVTGDSSILTSLSKMKKNNTGYDLKSIICNSEGTLGLISKALIKVYPKPVDSFTFFTAYKNLKVCIESFKQIRNIYYDKLESAELITNFSFDICLKNNFLNKHFFDKQFPWYIIFRFNLYEDKEEFQNYFEKKYELISYNISDMLIPKSIEQEKKFWKFRDDLVEAYKMEGDIVTNDISIPLNRMEEFFIVAQNNIKKMLPNIKFHPFGHIGDGNIHFNMIIPELNSNDSYIQIRDKIYSYINNLVEDFGGSFSAEHGIGQIKKSSLLKFKSEYEINLMKNLKKAFDPKNILNPGKIFDY